jgi:predicted DNA-binding antitoxin AbrB/MazE fold protein
MQLEAIYDNGHLEFVQPVQLKSTRIRLMVSVPDEEVAQRPEVYPEYDLTDFPESVQEDLAKWEVVRARALARQVADDAPEMTEKQKERWEAFAFREAVRREQGRPV